MEALSVPPDATIQKYFRAWQEQSSLELGQIFAYDATYRIKSSGKTLYGLDAITLYWNRNCRRQLHLTVEWMVKGNALIRSARFRASFFDVEERQSQVVSGTLRLVYTEDGRIQRLVECYSKVIVYP